MVLKELSNLDLWLWVYRENVRNYPGIHCSATPATCATLATDFEAMQRTGSGTRLIPVRPIAPSDEAKITGG